MHVAVGRWDVVGEVAATGATKDRDRREQIGDAVQGDCSYDKSGTHSWSMPVSVEEAWNRPVAVVRQELTVAPVPSKEARLIGCTSGQQVLRIDRVFHDDEDVAVQYTVNYFNSDRYRYRVELHRTRQSADGGVPTGT